MFTKEEIECIGNAFEKAINEVEIGYVWDRHCVLKVPDIINRKKIIDVFKKELINED